MTTPVFVPAPDLPDWLAAELPFRRRVFLAPSGRRILA